MVKVEEIFFNGMDFAGGLLWLAAPEDRFVAAYDPVTGDARRILSYRREVWDVCARDDVIWMVTGGGTLGRQIVQWSLKEQRELGKFNCPDGAGAGIALLDGRLWLTHRHNRKLFCLDPENGKVNWMIRTEQETFSPAACGNELWLVESDPGPLGHWSDSRRAKYFLSRYDPTRERIVERLPLAFAPCALALDGERFWFSEKAKKGIFSTKKNPG